MNNIYKKIRKRLKSEPFDGNPAYTKKLIHMTKDLVKPPQKPVRQRSFWIKRIPVVIFAILIAAYPVKAASNYVASRLARLSEKEKNELRTMIYENNTQDPSLDLDDVDVLDDLDILDKEAIRYSRDLSESEQELYDSLLVQYDQGIFPDGTLAVSDDSHTADQETLCYNAKDNCIYLPNRELTSEEFLQIIDFYKKTDYSLRTSDTTARYKIEMEKKRSQISPNALSEEEVVASAASYLKIMYGITAENMETGLSGSYGDYQITFVADHTTYSVCVQAKDASFQNITMEKDGFAYYHENLKINKKQIQKKGKEAKAIAFELLGETSTITNACAQYKLNENGQIPHGSIVYLFDLANGNRLRMSYSIAEDMLWGATIEEGGAGHKDLHVKNNETRVFLDID